MKILIIGADGQVGKNIFSSALKAGGFNVAGTYRTPENRQSPDLLRLDLSEPESIKRAFEVSKPEIVVLCSAMTHVDNCEKDSGLARKINVDGVKYVVENCQAFNSRLAFFSTEYVFDGKNGPYGENDETDPISEYGRTKLEGEQIALNLPESLVIRTTVVYSHSLGGKNFLMQILRKGALREDMNVPDDQYSNPTHAGNLADFTLELIKLKKSGIYNIVGKDLMSRYEFALKICEIFGLNPDFIHPKRTRDLSQMARRPLKAGLKTSKIFSKLNKEPDGADSALRLIKSSI